MGYRDGYRSISTGRKEKQTGLQASSGRKSVNPFQRKIVLILSKSPANVNSIAAALAWSYVTAAREIMDLERMGIVTVDKSDPQKWTVRITRKAEGLVPRIREIEQ